MLAGWHNRPETDTLRIQYNTGIRIQYVSPFRGALAMAVAMAMAVAVAMAMAMAMAIAVVVALREGDTY